MKKVFMFFSIVCCSGLSLTSSVDYVKHVERVVRAEVLRMEQQVYLKLLHRMVPGGNKKIIPLSKL